MEWTFESMLKRYSDPFASNVIGVESTPLRSGYASELSKENLIYWNEKLFYTENTPNSYFMFEFKRSPYIFTKYRLRGIMNSCAPFCWNVLGSIDNVTFTTLHSVDRSLCRLANTIPGDCSETFSMTIIEKIRYIKVINTNGECNGAHMHFGLLGVDFYGSPIINIMQTNVCSRRIDYILFVLFVMC